MFKKILLASVALIGFSFSTLSSAANHGGVPAQPPISSGSGGWGNHGNQPHPGGAGHGYPTPHN